MVNTSFNFESSADRPFRMCFEAEAKRKYAVGKILELNKDNSDYVALSLTIVEHLGVGGRRRSQVVLAKLDSGNLESSANPALQRVVLGAIIVVRVFDLELIYNDETWTGTHAEYCDHLASNEVKSYTSMKNDEWCRSASILWPIQISGNLFGPRLRVYNHEESSQLPYSVSGRRRRAQTRGGCAARKNARAWSLSSRHRALQSLLGWGLVIAHFRL